MPPGIRLVIRRLEAEGWRQARTRRHLVFRHPDKPGATIVVPNHPADEISPGVLRGFVSKGRLGMKYAVVIEKLEHNYCAHVANLPVCVTTGQTLEETRANLRYAVAIYVEVCREYGDPVAEPTTLVEELDVA